MRLIEKMKNFVQESARVFRVTKKPTKDEYFTILKVSAIGILVIGLLGFLLHIIEQLTNLLVVAVVVILLVLILMFWKSGGN